MSTEERLIQQNAEIIKQNQLLLAALGLGTTKKKKKKPLTKKEKIQEKAKEIGAYLNRKRLRRLKK